MGSLSLAPPPPPLSCVSQFFLEERTVPVHDQEGNISQQTQGCAMERKGLHCGEEIMQESTMAHHDQAYQKGLHDKSSQSDSDVLKRKFGPDSVRIIKVREGDQNKGAGGAPDLMKNRPGRLVVPPYCPQVEFAQVDRKLENKQFEVQGRYFSLVSRKGRREVMEDGYGVMIDILGDAKLAFFAVIDGHGGRAAVDYVAENLGKNIVNGLQNVDCKVDGRLEQAIRGGYLATDKEFLSQGVSSGACAATVLLKDGELHVANAGDCRVVLSRNGVADVLTNDHRVNREDERLRIENSGGFLHCRNGIWRVHGSLAVSRAIGDLHLKQWIISDPEIKRVNEQEAVDLILRDKNSIESCKKLVDISLSRGSSDDITVMVINLRDFATNACVN
ncbi:PROTEIN PHOSPHATASE 2C [Salix koriyanagi]|uniref:PROTEIN PHOSPHATASE 2C n=1 Tax=Salix koriyanagi TaxID=2511006 RepID=A0A9Q1A8U6_9ROSI|nr:PROTEIN PHOSPHATASE 2C [Salix koriyanagi]